MWIQIVLTIFILFALSRVFVRVRAKELRPLTAFFWVLFWLAAGAAVIKPQSTVFLANRLGVGRGSDLVFYFSIVLLFYVLFRVLIRLERVERDITKVVQAVALAGKKK